MSDSSDPLPSGHAHSSWSIEFGRFRIAVTRTRAMPAARPRASAFAAGALAGVGGVALLVVGANAAPQPAATVRYMVSVPVPAAARHLVRATPKAPVAGRQTPKPAAALTGERFDAADEPHVARAMATGAFQQWEDADGMPRFLTAGPARFTNGRACRDLALLVRLAGGGSHVRSVERCTTGPVTDDLPAADATVGDTSDGADQ